MAYTLTNITDDIRNYTEVDSGVLTTAVICSAKRYKRNSKHTNIFREKRYQLYGSILRYTKHSLWDTKVLCQLGCKLLGSGTYSKCYL
jgi:hypothetical protein